MTNQRIKEFTQRLFLFNNRDGTVGVRVVDRLADAVEAWLAADRVQLRGLSPLLASDATIPAPARLQQLSARLLNPDTGQLGDLPDPDSYLEVVEQSLTLWAFGDELPQAGVRQRLSLFTQITYVFHDQDTGRTLATRMLGNIERDSREWLAANQLRAVGLGQPHVRQPRQVDPATLPADRLVDPATRKPAPWPAEANLALEYLIVLPVFGQEEVSDVPTTIVSAPGPVKAAGRHAVPPAAPARNGAAGA